MLRAIARKTKCRVRISKKVGLPFVVNKYRHRKTFIIGAAVSILLVYTLTSFIWAIEIKGNKKIESQIIIDNLATLGIRLGSLKYKIDVDKVVNEMMLDNKDLAWVGLTVKGTKVKVELVERVKPPELIPRNVPCDIIAGRDGVIKTIVAKAGNEVVKAGDTVMAGQVLISGTIPGKDEKATAKRVHAIGVVKARTWYEANCPVREKVFEKERTGKVKEHYSLILLAKRFNIYSTKEKFKDYDKEEIRKRISIGEDLVLPFELIIDRYYETNFYEREISMDDAKRIAAEKAYADVKGDIPECAEIIKTKTVFVQKTKGNLEVNVVIECVEDIGIIETIGGK